MRKLTIILALASSMMLASACRFYNENIASTEDCAKWYLEQCYEYAIENDTKEFIETLTQFEKWYEELDGIEQERAMIAAKEWERENTAKMKCVKKYGRKVL